MLLFVIIYKHGNEKTRARLPIAMEVCLIGDTGEYTLTFGYSESEYESCRTAIDRIIFQRKEHAAKSQAVQVQMEQDAQELLDRHLLVLSTQKAECGGDYYCGEMANVLLAATKNTFVKSDEYRYDFCLTHASMGFSNIVKIAEFKRLNGLLAKRKFRVQIAFDEQCKCTYGSFEWYDKHSVQMALLLLKSASNTCPQCQECFDVCLCFLCGIPNGRCKCRGLETSAFRDDCSAYAQSCRKYAQLRKDGKWTGGRIPNDVHYMTCDAVWNATHVEWMAVK